MEYSELVLSHVQHNERPRFKPGLILPAGIWHPEGPRSRWQLKWAFNLRSD